ncbi:MAG TPA: methionine synthase, partial [Anaerolineae bacterium]|nr:methionine synthase [Anaerolineae bacterium]
VELNEPHHWGMRDASDVICVVSAYLSAYNARAFGVKDYIAQLMFNSPPGLSDALDLAKMLAMLDIIEPLATPDFHIWRQSRTGLLSYPVQVDEARAHLAASVYVQMAVQPHIIHVVSYTEADHAATADEVIESCRLARRALENALRGAPDLTADPRVHARRAELVQQAQLTLAAIAAIADRDVSDPLIDPGTLARAVQVGILDAPQLRTNRFAPGTIITRCTPEGACIAVDSAERPLREQERLAHFLQGA